VAPPDAVIPQTLRSRYDEPWRHYHTMAHIDAMEGHLRDALATGVTVHDLPACQAFIWWHDAVYEPEASPSHNELRSAELCGAEMAASGYEPVAIQRAVAMIEATARHTAPEATTAPDAPLMLDIDLSILGASPGAYEQYAHAIRHEYAHVAEQAYREGRARILREFLIRPTLYLSDWARSRWDRSARTNLAWEIAALTAASPRDEADTTPG
jgi:predicted metal-dependent HD superfamily phosphohydrolase